MGMVGKVYALITADTTSFTRKMTALGVTAGKLGKSLTMGLTAPLAAIGVGSVAAFASFDKAMTESLAIMGGISDSMREKMENVAKTISEKTTFSATELAQAYYYLASAGMSAEQSVAALDKVACFAQAGAFDLATATDLLTDAQTAMGLSSKDAVKNQENLVRVSDVLVGANTLANASVQQFSEALTNMAAAALTNVNKGLEEGVAILTVFADKGIKGQKAGMKLSMMLNALDKAASKNKEAWKKYNVQLWDSQGNMRHIGDIIGDMEKAFKDLTPEAKAAAIAELGFDTRTKNSILSLMGSSKQLLLNTKALKEIGGVTDKVANKQMEAFSNQLTVVKNMLVNVGAEIGEILVPIIKKLIDNYIKPAIERFKSLSDGTKKLIVGVATFTATLGPLLMLFSKANLAIITLAGATSKLSLAFKTLSPSILLAYGAYKGLMALREKFYKFITGKHIQTLDEERKMWNIVQKTVGGFTDSLYKLNQRLKENGVEAKTRGKIFDDLNKSFNDGKGAVELYKEVLAGKWGEDAKKAFIDISGAEGEALASTVGLSKETEGLREIIEKAEKDAKAAAETLNNNLSPAAKTTSEEFAALKKRAEELGVLENTKTKVEELEGKLLDLRAELANGNISWGDFINQSIQIKDSITSIKDEFSDLGMAIEDDAGEYEDYGDTVKGVYDDLSIIIPGYNDDIENDTEETTIKVKSFWDTMADGLQTKWASTIGEVLSGATSLKDGLKGIWDAMKQQFFDIIGQMIAKFLTDFVSKIATSAVNVGSSITENVGDALGGLASSVKDIGSTVTSALSGGVSSLISGAVSGIVSGLIGGKTDMDATNRELHNIWAEARNILNNVDNMKWQNETLKTIGWESNKILGKIKDGLAGGTGGGTVSVDFSATNDLLVAIRKLLALIRDWTKATHLDLKKIGGFQTGGIAWTPQLAMVAEHEPEVIIPFSKLGGQGGLSKGLGSNINITYAPRISAMDAQDVYQFMSGKGKDALIKILRSNTGGFTREIKAETEKF